MTCAKRRVRCTIVARTGESVIGENSCEAPQIACPRTDEEVAAADYSKCKTICRQLGHAEDMAVAAALARPYVRWDNAEALIEGHYYACISCQKSLRLLGVNTIHFGEPNL